jgi:mandelate racemase
MSNVTTPTIETLRARPVLVPMVEPHRTASGVIEASPLVLVDAILTDGTVGHAIIFTYTPAALEPTATLVRNLEPLVRGETLAPAALADSLAARFRLLGTQGLVGMALAGLDMALWDTLARLHETPLVTLLGGTPRKVRPYGAVGYDGVEGSARSAARWAELGFQGIKAKIGYLNVFEDIAVVRAMREAVGEDVDIMVDYNQSLTPVEAETRLRALDEEGLTWVEEPTLATDHTGSAAVARTARTPIQCGENWWGIADMHQSLTAGASDLVMPDVMKIGGVTGWMRAVALAEAHARPMSNHLWPELSARLLCCTPTAHWLEYSDWWNPILAEPLRIVDGLAVIDDTPGSGIIWNEAAVARFAA